MLILHSKPASSLAFLAEREKIKCKNLFFSSFPRKNRLVSRDLPFICCEAAHVLYSKIKNQFLDASPNSLSFTVIKGPARSTSCSVLRWSRTSLGGQTQHQDLPCCSKILMKGLMILRGAWRGLTKDWLAWGKDAT